jgi:diacylglycerol kinase (ATP)
VRIGLLNNLRAGRSDDQVTRMLQHLRAHPEVVSVETESAHGGPEALAELARQEVEILAVNGGDGTVQHVLTEILGRRAFGGRVPIIAPLRGGRTNMTALDLGARRDPVKGLQRVIDAVKSDRLESILTERNVLKVEYGLHCESLYGMFCGLGMIHRAIELTHRVIPKGQQGALGATLVTAGLMGRNLMGHKEGVLEPDKVQLLLDDELVDGGEYLLLITSTLGRLFAGMRPFWGQGPGPVRFTSVATGSAHKPRAFQGILRGRPGSVVTEANGYTSRNVKHAELRLDCGFTVDGELVAPEPGRTLAISADDRVRFAVA